MGTFKALRPLLAAGGLSIDWPLVAVGVQTGLAAAAAYFSSMNVALQILVIVVGLHLLATLALVFSPKSDKGIRGFLQDVVAKGIAVALVAFLGSRPELQFTWGDQSVSFGALIGFFIILSEVIGFGHDMEQLGTRIFPKFLMNLMENTKDGIDNGKAVSVLSQFSRRMEGTKEVVTKSTTVVTEQPEEKK